MLTVTSKPLYYGLFAIFALNMVLLVFTRATLGFDGTQYQVGWSVAFGLLFFSFNRMSGSANQPRRWVATGRNLFEGLLFTQLVSFNLPLLNHLTMLAPLPLQDDLLISLDRSLGLDWLAYFELVHSSPLTIWLFQESYEFLSLFSLLALGALIVMNDTRRARFFIEVFFVTAVFCTFAGAFFPAFAAVETLIPDLSHYTNFTHAPGVYHVNELIALRDPTASVVLSPGSLSGLVTFPSFHTASGVLLCVVFFRTWLFVPVAIYSTLMIASSPIFGGHYLIDLIAGAMVALAMSALFLRLPRYQGLLSRQAPALAPKTAQSPSV